jgi:MSHA biogenesis protein MshK
MKNNLRKVVALLATGFLVAAAADVGDLPDPTNPSGHAGAGAASSGVQSILITPRRKQAVIHGRTVRVGDRVGDAVVVDIQPYEVILNRGGRESRMRLVPRLEKQKKEGGAS